MGGGRSIADTAKVLSRYVDMIMFRCHSHCDADGACAICTHACPVINGLTDYSHPCQIMADIMTFEEHRGSIKGKKVAWIGDGNNVCNSFVAASAQFGFDLAIACPHELKPDTDMLNWSAKHGGKVTLARSPQEAVKGASLVVTDTWVSMGDAEEDKSKALLQSYQVNDELMALADKEALFMHCLPAHRGEEVTASVIDGAQSVVWDEAENRLHAQKAILLWCLGK